MQIQEKNYDSDSAWSIPDPVTYCLLCAGLAGDKDTSAEGDVYKRQLYVTLEPCQMCAGAIVQARVSEVVIGSMNPKAGCAGSILNMLEMHEFNHQVKVERGVLKEECSEMLSAFFRRLRVVKKKKKEERERAEEGKE